ncbi:unnamed protein product, partial [marine sediment metagenome]
LLGLRKEVLSSKMIWLCARCYACTANCPQEVSFADIIVVLRDMAIKEGYASRELPDKIDHITEAANEFRKNCINILNGINDISWEEAFAKAKKTAKEL